MSRIDLLKPSSLTHSRSRCFGLACATVVGLAMSTGTTNAFAGGDVFWSIGINVPNADIGVYTTPQRRIRGYPVYEEVPVYVERAPVIIRQRPLVIYERPYVIHQGPFYLEQRQFYRSKRKHRDHDDDD